MTKMGCPEGIIWVTAKDFKINYTPRSEPGLKRHHCSFNAKL